MYQEISLFQVFFSLFSISAKLAEAGALEYTDCLSAEE